MTNEKFEAVKALISELLADPSVTFADEAKKEQIITGMALLYDQLLYESDGKKSKIPYRDFRAAYRIYNSEHLEDRKTYTLAELAQLLNTSPSTVYQIVEGRYWGYVGFTPYMNLEEEKDRATRRRRGRELLGLPAYESQPAVVKAKSESINKWFMDGKLENELKPGSFYFNAFCYNGNLFAAGYSKIEGGNIDIQYSFDGIEYLSMGTPVSPRTIQVGYRKIEECTKEDFELNSETKLPTQEFYFRACFKFYDGQFGYSEVHKYNPAVIYADNGLERVYVKK